MSKPWETETWTVREDGIVVHDGAPEEFSWVANFTEFDAIGFQGVEIARAKLAAAAPEMARVLMQIQYTPTGYDSEPCCPVCGLAAKCDRSTWPHGHIEDCELLHVLRKAGVLE